MRRNSLPFALGLGLLVLVPEGVAHAYCRTSSCMTGGAHTAAVCNPPQMDDCGIAIAWTSPCITFSVQQNASNKLRSGGAVLSAADAFTQTEQTLRTAFGTWMSVACSGGGSPHILVSEAPSVSCDLHEYNQNDGNANIILYHDSSWPYEGSSNTLALTTVTYALDSGEIYDADMEINTADNDFTVGNTGVDFDLLSIVTHETGHFLGLAHSHDTTATMWPAYNEHSTNLRTPGADDIAGICAIYPPQKGASICSCDPTPRHGFSSICGAQETGDGVSLATVCQGSTPTTIPTTTVAAPSGCCSVAPGTEGPPSGRYAAALAALGAIVLAARRKRRG